jgi:hypothetical protein
MDFFFIITNTVLNINIYASESKPWSYEIIQMNILR